MADSKSKTGGEGSVDMLSGDLPMDDFLPYLLNRITNRLNLNLLEDLRPLKINVARWRVLAVLGSRDRRSIGELAAYTVMDQSTLSRVIDQMERDGLVERQQSDADSRVVQVHLLDAGRQLFETILPKALIHMDHALESLSEGEKKALMGLLHKILDNVRASPFG